MKPDKNAVNWIAVDWGTSNLRAFAMDGRGDVLAEASSAAGMGSLRRDQFEAALLALIEPWLGEGVTPVFACGMVGARQGWTEAAYHQVPCAPLDGAHMTQVLADDPRLSVRIIPGLCQMKPADVMRGEETQIAGYLAGNPGFDGVLCLPGTHCKWVRISAGEVVSFQTFMTGEIFALLSGQSVLRHSLNEPGWDEAAFVAALDETLSRPEKVAARLFSLRAEGLIEGLSPQAARARLSGILIGAELAAARPYWLGQAVVVIGAGTLAGHYARALAAQGVVAATAPADGMTLAGLKAARALGRNGHGA